VEDTLLYPDSGFGSCARNLFLSAKFTPPPHGEYWINIRMQFKK